MDVVNKLELHYYFCDDTHEIDALIKNKCESELLSIITETAEMLDIDAKLVSEAYEQGGFREFWRFLGTNGTQITLLLFIIQNIMTAIPLIKEDNNDELNRLSIEEKKLSIKKLKLELGDIENSNKIAENVAKTLNKDLKVIKRKSNFYSQLDKYHKVNQIGFSLLNSDGMPYREEMQVSRSDFNKYILSTNKLKSEENDNAVIEIVSPVLKEGNYKWKGIYKDETISFEMRDSAFRDSVFFDNLPFQHGSRIQCVLIISRELDEVGEVKITGYSVTTVIEKIDGTSSVQTPQGKKYKLSKKLMEGQGNLFD